MRVDEVMTSGAELVTVAPEATLKEVADLMVARGSSGIPVVDADRRVLGVVSEADIVGSEAGPAGEGGLLARARALAARPTSTLTVDVAVEEGEVRLSGEVDSATSARLLEYFASRVPGVVAVSAQLRVQDDGAGDHVR